MEGEELQLSNKFLQSDHMKLALRIIEYVWAHRMTDTLEDLDSSCWPEMDPQPLSLEDPLRLRVGSVQAYFIVRSRDSEHYETVMDFLETTHRLLPQLVSPIKHMKIMFGLKTMLIMTMLKKRSGLVDTMVKINQLFPSKLPQYQDHCSQHEMFLMRKNHLDFKAFVQVLALKKDKLEDYVENQMEDQYGELYAQKVEERLLHYLLRLEAALPGDTCVDQILKRGSPMTEEEKTLVKVVSSDSSIIVKTLKKLLHCGVVSSSPGGVSESLKSETGHSLNSKSTSHSSSSRSESLLVSVEAKRLNPETDPDMLEDSHLMKDDLKRSQPQTEGDEGEEMRQEENSDSVKAGTGQSSSEDVQRSSASPQFCSKHRRWVKNILQECPTECSQELQLQANVSSSPPLFPSSSGSSSDDLTPSNLLLLPPASHASTHLQTSGSGSNTSESEPPHQLPSLRDALQPGVLLPVVRLIDIASVDQFSSIFRSQQASNYTQRAASASSPQVGTSGDVAIRLETVKDSTPNRSEALASTPQDESTSTCRSSPRRCSARVLKRSRPGSQTLGRVSVHHSAQSTFRSSCPPLQTNISGPPQQDASTSTTQPESLKTETPFQHGSLPHPHLSTPSETSRIQRAQLKLSLCCQSMLLQSKLLQPCVSLVRLRETGRGGEENATDAEDGRVEGEEEDADSSFDVNFLYSSSSDDESKESLRSDPHYKPSIKRKRLLIEYEAARSLNNI